MATDKRSPKRRSSIAVPNQNQPSIVPKGRRRAHSIVPGAKLSPLAKARRALAPRKSILKASVNILNVDSSSQQSSQNSTNDDINATQSMEITQDYTAPVHDNTSRKSLARRVSFASHSHVRMFEKNHTNSTASPQSSPASVSAQIPHVQTLSNENDYPRRSTNRRRSSMRYSMTGSDDMDMTTIASGPFQVRGSAILDEEFDEEYDDDDMDVTEAIRGDFARKRSLSMGGRRLTQLQSPQHPEEGNETRSDIGDESMQSVQSDAASEQSQAMEFTVPLGQSLRRAEHDDVWLALRQMTHSGGEPPEPESSFEEETSLQEDDGMHLDDAMARLRRARDSLPLSANQAGQHNEPQDDSFTSEEDSLGNEDDIDGNKTLNLTHVLGRASIGLNSRMSIGYESNMDESEVYGNIVASNPRHSLAPQSQPSHPFQPSQPELPLISFQQPQQPLVFQPSPPTTSSSVPAAPVGQPRKSTGGFSFTPKPVTPSKNAAPSLTTPSNPKPKSTFSAAFAPPVTRPSPRKAAPLTEPHSSPAKRPLQSTHDDAQNMDRDQPSPAKRQALAGKWLGAAEGTSDVEPSVSPTASRTQVIPPPRPLSPSKKAPFQASAPASQAESTSRPSTLRRPSGYFAKRKSLAVSFNVLSTSTPAAPAPAPAISSKKKAGIGMGRASMGAAPADAWTRFDKHAASSAPEKVSPSNPKDSANELEAEGCIREAAHQASASPSPGRGSPAPNRARSVERVAESEIPEPSPMRQEAIEIEDEPETPDLGELSGDMEIDTDATQQWRQGVEQEYEEEEEMPSISVAQFFSMTGIKFMDELTAPRRSIHPSQQPIRHARNPADIPLAEYVAAMAIDIPQLDLYSRVSKDLEAWMAKSKVVFAQAEEEAAKVTPELFVEYARADEEGQAELLHQLNLIRTHTRYMARSDWYDWKLQWVEGLRITAEEAFASLEKDARALEEPKKSANEIIPELEKEYETLIRELEQEQAEVAEVEGSDQDYLNELKATIAEQNIEIEALKAELKEGEDQVRWLSERMSEIEVQKREAKNTISTAERVLRMKQTSTRSEVFRLKAELEALEDLNMFSVTKVNADLFEYIYGSLFHISIPCRNFIPVVAKVKISRYGKLNTRYKDDFPRLSEFLLVNAKQLITESDDMTVREIIHRLADYWSSCAQLRTQLMLLSVKYPVEIVVPPTTRDVPTPTFKAQVTVMFPRIMGKACISFVFSFDTFSQWPISISSLDCETDIVYGPMDRAAILKALIDRLSQASPSDNYACLLDACIEAQDIYH